MLSDAMKTREYWDSFYSGVSAPKDGSSWANFCLKFLNDQSAATTPSHIVDLGCGNGRDTMFFADNSANLHAIGIDQSHEATIRNQATAQDKGLAHSTSFLCGDFTNPSVLGDAIDALDSLSPTAAAPRHYYSRFTLHAIPRVAATRVIQFIAQHLNEGSYFFIEARSVLGSLYGQGTADPDGDPDAWINGHYRRFLRIAEVISELEAHGLTVLFQDERAGLSAYQGDDPVLIRLVVTKEK